MRSHPTHVVHPAHELDCILVLRFGTRVPSDFKTAFCTYAAIGRALNMSAYKVRCKVVAYQREVEARKTVQVKRSERLANREVKKRKYYGTLTREHEHFLASQRTLQRWVGKTLVERAALFH